MSAEKHYIRPCPAHSTFSFIWIFIRIADNLGQVRVPTRSDYSLWSYLPLSAKKKTTTIKHHIRPCLEHSRFNHQIFIRLAGDLDRQNISDEFEFRPDRTIDRHNISDEFEFRLDQSLNFLPFSAEKKKQHIRPCSGHSLLSFKRNFMKVADNLDMHKISDKFELHPDWIIDSGFTCPLVSKNTIYDLVRSIACLVFYWIFMKVADNLDRHKISDEFECRQDRTIRLGVTCQKTKPYYTLCDA